MKKVHFGYENSNRPVGSFEGLGVSDEAKGPIQGNFIGILNYMDKDFLITKVSLAYKTVENQVGKIDVRDAIADIYPDGSGVLYIDRQKSDECLQLENLFNDEKTKELLQKGVSINNIFTGGILSFAFECVTKSDVILATSIKHEIFEKKKQLISCCNHSFSDLQQEIEELCSKENNRII